MRNRSNIEEQVVRSGSQSWICFGDTMDSAQQRYVQQKWEATCQQATRTNVRGRRVDWWSCGVMLFALVPKKLIIWFKGIKSRNCFQTPPVSVCQRCTFNKIWKTWMSKCLSVPYAVVRPSSQPALTTTRHTWQVQLLARYLAEYPGTGHSVDGFNKPHRGLAASKWKW